MEAKAGSAQRKVDDWARQYHQWQSRIDQGSTQVNSTGVYWAMYWALYIVQGCTQTKLCYRYRPMAKEELGKGFTSDEWQKVRLSRVQSGNEKKSSPSQPLGQRAMTS